MPRPRKAGFCFNASMLATCASYFIFATLLVNGQW